MNIKKITTITLICITVLFTNNLFARGGSEGGSSQDPLASINYREAFDQKKYRKNMQT